MATPNCLAFLLHLFGREPGRWRGNARLIHYHQLTFVVMPHRRLVSYFDRFHECHESKTLYRLLFYKTPL